MGFFSKHTTETGLLWGVAAGTVGLLLVVPLGPLTAPALALWDGELPTIAWPWYPIIAGGINIAVAYAVSLLQAPSRERLLEASALAGGASLAWWLSPAPAIGMVAVTGVTLALVLLLDRICGGEWPDYSVPGQAAMFRREGRATARSEGV